VTRLHDDRVNDAREMKRTKKTRRLKKMTRKKGNEVRR
jgi:hypothetical protein